MLTKVVTVDLDAVKSQGELMSVAAVNPMGAKCCACLLCHNELHMPNTLQLLGGLCYFAVSNIAEQVHRAAQGFRVQLYAQNPCAGIRIIPCCMGGICDCIGGCNGFGPVMARLPKPGRLGIPLPIAAGMK